MLIPLKFLYIANFILRIKFYLLKFSLMFFLNEETQKIEDKNLPMKKRQNQTMEGHKGH